MLDNQWVLYKTRLDEVYVLLLLVAVIAVSFLVLRLRPASKRLRQSFVVVAVCMYSALLVVWLMNFSYYLLLVRDHHVLEWLTAHFLLVGGVMAFVLAVRLARRGEPSPIAVFLSAGYLLAFWRELEWGETFWGRVWFSRNMFRPHRWFDRDYFESFLKSVEQNRITGDQAMWINLGHSLLAIVLASVVCAYLIKHWGLFVEQLRGLYRSTYGRWFFVGIGIYVGAQIVEDIVNLLPGSDTSPFWEADRDTTGLPRVLRYLDMRSLDEPLELLGSYAFWISTLKMWLDKMKSSQLQTDGGSLHEAA